MKTILMLLQSEFPPDIRLEKEITSLTKNDFKVIVLCNQYEKEKAPCFNSCEIFRVKAIFRSVKLNKIVNFPIFFNPRFLIKAFKVSKKSNPAAIHAHDLPMVPVGLLLKKIFKVPLIFDMHENYPQALKYFNKKGIFNFIFKNYKLATLLEKYVLRKVDYVIVVVDESKNNLVNKGIDPEKIFVVSNTVNVNTFNSKINFPEVAEKYKNKFVIIYSGRVSPDRGLDVPIYALKYLKTDIPNVLILIIGNGEYVSTLKKISRNEDVGNFVEFIPWPGHDNISSYLLIADILMVPQPNNDFINSTVPHKLFEYMFVGRTLLVSDAVPLKRIINETKSGVVFNSGDPTDFARKVLLILNSNYPYGENGQKATEQKYNWENDSKVFIGLYKSLVS
jgi:glycosyltransferase involved in cell wall biosynthesis